MKKKERTAILKWMTWSEVDCEQFIVEKSSDGINWRTHSTVMASGNSDQKLLYETIDVAPASGINYYRIKFEPLGQSAEYSEIKSVSFDYLYSVYPNPSSNLLNIVNLLDDSKLTQYQIIDAMGKVILDGNFINKSEEINVDLLKTGVYLIKIVQSDELIESIRFVKN